MNIKLEYACIIARKISPSVQAFTGDMQFSCWCVTFGPPCISAISLHKEMAHQTYSLVILSRRLISAANDASDNFPSAEDEHEPGQQSGIGNVALRRVSLDDPQDRSRTDLCIIKGEYFRENLKKMDAVLLDIHNSNGLYLCERQEMEAKIHRHMR